MSKRILVVGPSWIGDMVMAQSLFMALQAREPCEIDVLAPSWSRPLLARMPQVREAIDLPFAHGELDLMGRYRLGRRLHGQGYGQAIVLPNSFKSALPPLIAGIPWRTGWRGEMRGLLLNDCRVLEPERLPLMVQRFVALAGPAGAPLPDPVPRPLLETEPGAARAALQALEIEPPEKVMVLCPGAEFGDAKRWPTGHYAALAGRMLEQGWQVWLLGSANDAQLSREIVQALPAGLEGRCRDLAGRTTLAQAIDLLSLADAVVSNDSGLMHVAAALQRPLIALYGSTTASFTPPLADRVKLLSHEIECRPCFQRECPLGHKRCLTEITPEHVHGQLLTLLGQGNEAGVAAPTGA